ncbi:Dicer-like protein 2 [Sporothrix eucalyptigena]
MLTISEPAATTVSDLQSHMPKQLWTGHKYPWELLLGLGANKFHSDILEAVIGAIWVDSGSMTEVERLLEKVGILPYLRRAVKEDIHLMHPKEELGTVTGSAKIRYEVTRLTRAEAASLDACKTPLFDPRNENGKRRSLNRLEKASGDDESTSTNDSSETTALNSDHEAEIRHRTIVGDTMNDIGYSCRLFFNGKDKFEVSFCHSREEAEAAVANMALTAWRQGQLGNEKKA